MTVNVSLLKTLVWYFVLHFGVVNQIVTEPTNKWWLIEIAVAIVSMYMSSSRVEED